MGSHKNVWFDKTVRCLGVHLLGAKVLYPYVFENRVYLFKVVLKELFITHK